VVGVVRETMQPAHVSLCCSTLVAREEGSHNAPSHHKESGFTESADRSIARRAKSSYVSHGAVATSTLTNSAFS
jgi:hypothetical protein